MSSEFDIVSFVCRYLVDERYRCSTPCEMATIPLYGEDCDYLDVILKNGIVVETDGKMAAAQCSVEESDFLEETLDSGLVEGSPESKSSSYLEPDVDEMSDVFERDLTLASVDDSIVEDASSLNPSSNAIRSVSETGSKRKRRYGRRKASKVREGSNLHEVAASKPKVVEISGERSDQRGPHCKEVVPQSLEATDEPYRRTAVDAIRGQEANRIGDEEANETTPEIVDNTNEEFEGEMQRCEQIISELTAEIAVKIQSDNIFARDEVVALASKIEEVECQKTAVELGFRRAWMLDEAQSRRRREIFRLRNKLPALAKRIEFEDAMSGRHQFLVVMGQTGSGKSTQLVQYVADMPEFAGRPVICTQPRKIAAVSLAERVAYEFGSKEAVGYHVGGRKRLHPRNRIQFMTESVLLHQITNAKSESDDPLSRCCAVIVDEAHTRATTTDVLLGVLKRRIDQWPRLKVIVTSATINTAKFSAYLNNCPIVEIPGRLFPVDVVYKPNPEGRSVIDAVVQMAVDICASDESGDVLCFLTGQSEVEWANQRFTDRAAAAKLSNVRSFRLYGKLPPEEQSKVFPPLPDAQRKVIFSTDIAETSVTIDGVRFVVDSGLTKNMVYDSVRNISTLKEMMVSRAAAEQRKGRAGRTTSGKCFRIFSQLDYDQMAEYDKAEVFCRPLGITITMLKAMGVDPFEFDWLEEPDRSSLESAMEELLLLGAIDDRQQLTELGRLIADLQIDPGIARMITFACHRCQGRAAVDLAGLFSVSSMIFWRGGDDESRQASDQSKQQFDSRQSDFVSIYRAFRTWQQLRGDQKAAKKWCLDNYINNKSMKMAESTSSEICSYLQRLPLWRKSQDQNLPVEREQDIQRLVTQAFVLNVAVLVDRTYLALRANLLTWIHPGSNYFPSKSAELPQVIVFQNILRTSKTFAVNLTAIDWDWIRQDNETLHAFYEERAFDAKMCPVRIESVPHYILRTILGPANRHQDQVNEELDSFVIADFDSQALVAWCKRKSADEVERELRLKVQRERDRLKSEVREDPLSGETRLVWGCGGRAEVLLFEGEFLAINVRRVPSTWTLSDLYEQLRHRVDVDLSEVIRDAFFLAKSENPAYRTARVTFNCRKMASDALKKLQRLDNAAGLQFSSALTRRPSIFKETEAELQISFAIANSTCSCLLFFNTPAAANAVLRAHPPPISCLTISKENKFPTSNGVFVEGQNPDRAMAYVLYARSLLHRTDEKEIYDALERDGLPQPTYVKVSRASAVAVSAGEEEHAFWRKYAEVRQLIPFSDRVAEFKSKKNDKLKRVTIWLKYATNEDLEMALMTNDVAANEIFAQPVRADVQFKGSMRIERDLWSFREAEIRSALAHFLQLNEVTIAHKGNYPHVWIRMKVTRIERLQEIRQLIDRQLDVLIYKNPDRHLLFTRYGLQRLEKLERLPAHLHVDFRMRFLRIYGSEEAQQILKDRLDGLVEELKQLRVDHPLYIKRTSNIYKKKMTIRPDENSGLLDVYLSFNRLLVTGTPAAVDRLKEQLRDHLVQPKNSADEQCGICTDTLENPIFFKLCTHKFCSECIKVMMGQLTIPFPVTCPAENCGVELPLKDIAEISSDVALEKIRESAVIDLLERCPDQYRECFRPGCHQFLAIGQSRSVELTSAEEVRRGGRVVDCSQCYVSYCVDCSLKLNAPVERHRGDSCQERQLADDSAPKDVRFHRLYILDEICTLKCPRCRTAFVDFEGCCALICGVERCRASFCFFCLADCGTDAHSHVIKCPKNLNPGELFTKKKLHDVAHRETRKTRIVHYLKTKCQDSRLRSKVLESIAKNLSDLHVEILPEEVGLSASVELDNRRVQAPPPNIQANRVPEPVPVALPRPIPPPFRAPELIQRPAPQPIPKRQKKDNCCIL